MAKKKDIQTFVITAAQGIQNPYNARMYGRSPTNGKPNLNLIEKIEDYVKRNAAELEICSIPGSYINELELDPFFHERDDVYVEKNAKRRNEQNKKKEISRRNAWEKRNARKSKKMFGQTDEDNPEFLQELGMPMHYFWEEIPDTDYKITGKRLNSNIRVVGVPEPSQNKNPLVGKKIYTQEHGGNSIIIPSPKQNLSPVASGQAGEYPKLMITTGCCTLPSYNTTNRLGKIAEEAHKYGFVVVDIIDDKIYLPRIVNAQKNGTFIDLGIKYVKGKDPEKARTIAMVVGDSHAAEINPKVERANREMINWLQPKHIHYNDVFSARSINLHELEDLIAISNKFQKGLTSLEEELVLTGEYIKENALIAQEFGGEVVINYSNHDDMLYRWLTKGQYRNDKENMAIAYKILGQGIDRHDSFEKAIRYLILDLPKNVTFLKPGQDRIYWRFQCAAHGHLGKNGARGNLNNLTEGYGKVIMGHVHQFEIRGDSMSVGTSSKIPLEYQVGQPSTAMAANGVIYDGGLMQGIPIIKGRWAKKGFNDFLK